jgi:DNA-binding NarL/FixJ family response regulator
MPARRRDKYIPPTDPPPFPIADELWKKILAHTRTPKRQGDVVLALLRSSTDKEIKATLRMSNGTVRSHFDRLFMKLNVSHRVELVMRLWQLSRELSHTESPICPMCQQKHRQQ